MLALSNSFLHSNKPIDDRIDAQLQLPVEGYELGAENWEQLSAVADLVPNSEDDNTPLRKGRAELSREDLDAYAKALTSNNRQIVALENFNPRPPRLPKNSIAAHTLDLGAKDSATRMAATEASMLSLNAANAIGAKQLILHCSSLDIGKFRASIMSSWQKGKFQDPNLQRIIGLAMDKRPQICAPVMDAWKKSLDAILSEAQDNDIKIILRTPVFPWDFPNRDDLKTLFSEFKGSPLQVYYDSARLYCHEVLAMESTFEWRSSFSEHLAGYHINDSINFTLGHLPGQGSVPFDLLFKEVQVEKIHTIRARAPQSQEHLLTAIEYLKQLGIDGPPPAPWEDSLPIIGG